MRTALLLTLLLAALPAAATLAADRDAAAKGEPDAILRLGVARDTDSLHLLQGLADAKPDSDDAGHAARLALARLGERKPLEELLAGLAKKNTKSRRLRCLRALGYVGERATVSRIVPLLGEPGELGETAVETLGEILPSVQTQLLLLEPENGDRAGQWRRWWNDARGRDPSTWGAFP